MKKNKIYQLELEYIKNDDMQDEVMALAEGYLCSVSIKSEARLLQIAVF